MSVRPLLSAGALTAGAALAALTAAPVPAAAAPGPAPGEGGDVRIHQIGTPFDDPRTDPTVCAFYLAATGFGALDAVSWTIAPQPHEADGHSVAGRISLTGGSGQTSRLALPAGTYRLGWARQGAEGVGTHKAFTVSCPPDAAGEDAKNGNAAPPHARAAAAPAPYEGIRAEGAQVTSADDERADGDSTVFGVGSGLAALLAGGAGLVLAHRSRRRDDEPA
ncbi:MULTISPECIES: hypothetical protein [Streptomyces]|uniref:Gram-positive cocci surface proteins LPxTG domain-containing protein n=1 Tax=Streptomyces solicathayae TaxID=3081768 RepID=A0ABZ0M0J4_9ACTN|nr:hypothetical protein [Streptomyces sp. HUAS YS2]WOX25285.1 hypothetical protein R2D22_29485 [Streptomyces sp. HUAS YS2]